MPAVRKQLYYWWKKLSERQSRRKLATRFFKVDHERFQACADKKPAAQIRREMNALQKYWGCYPFQYYRYDLFRHDCALSIEEMKKYVPTFFFHHLFFPLSYKEYGILCEDKLISYALLKTYDVPQPNFLFCYDHNTFYNANNQPISNDEVDQLIATSQATKLFVKPRFGSEGKGIFVFNKEESITFFDAQQTRFSHRFFIENLRATAAEGRDTSGFFLVQEGLVQNESMNQIYPHAINSIRIYTECINTNVRITHALLRMGRGGNQVDNASSGGIYIKIDPATGVLHGPAFAFNRLTFDKHPDTNFSFDNAQIKKWNEVNSFALAVAEKFRELKYLGLDIAFTTQGVSVIELNQHPDFTVVEDCYGGVRDDLHITPKDWWYQSNYTIKNT